MAKANPAQVDGTNPEVKTSEGAFKDIETTSAETVPAPEGLVITESTFANAVKVKEVKEAVAKEVWETPTGAVITSY